MGFTSNGNARSRVQPHLVVTIDWSNTAVQSRTFHYEVTFNYKNFLALQKRTLIWSSPEQ